MFKSLLQIIVAHLKTGLTTSQTKHCLLLSFTETTGISFSPDGKHMYFAFQEDGMLFDLTRDDGLSFHGKTVKLKPRHDENPSKFRRQR